MGPNDFEPLLPNTFDYGFNGQQKPYNENEDLTTAIKDSPTQSPIPIQLPSNEYYEESSTIAQSQPYWTQSSSYSFPAHQLPSYEYGAMNPTPSHLDLWLSLKNYDSSAAAAAYAEKLNHRPSSADVAPYDDNVNYPKGSKPLLTDTVESMISQSKIFAYNLTIFA